MRLLLAVLLASCPLQAAADIFDKLTGAFEMAGRSSESCAMDPFRASFTANNRRFIRKWSVPVYSSLTGAMITLSEADVVSVSQDSIAIRLDGESRVGVDGKPLLFTLRLVDELNGFCWVYDGQAMENCRQVFRRCPDVGPVS